MADEQHSGDRGNFAEDRENASRTGQVDGKNSSGKFAHDPEWTAEAGRKGGRVGHRGVGSQLSDDARYAAGPTVEGNPAEDDYDDRDADGRSHTWSFLPLVDLRGWYS